MWSPARLRLKKSVHLSAKEIHTQTRNSVWESRLPYVLQRFVGTNLLWEGELFENLRTKHPENTSSDESLYAELVRLIHNILRICFNGSKMTTFLTHHQMHDKRKMPILSKETFLESGQLFKKHFQGRNLDTCAASSTQCPNFRGLKSNAHKVNSFFSKAGYSWHPFFLNNSLQFPSDENSYMKLNKGNRTW